MANAPNWPVVFGVQGVRSWDLLGSSGPARKSLNTPEAGPFEYGDVRKSESQTLRE